MAKRGVQSVEPNVADVVNGWLRSYGVDYKLEQERLNDEIDKALNEYYSKQGGFGGNRPDAKAIIQDKHGDFWPVLIEYKGYKDKLEKLGPTGISTIIRRPTPRISPISTATPLMVPFITRMLYCTTLPTRT